MDFNKEKSMNWLSINSLIEWENTWVWLKVTTPDRSYVYYTPICVCKYPNDRVVWKDNFELDASVHTIQVIKQPNV